MPTIDLIIIDDAWFDKEKILGGGRLSSTPGKPQHKPCIECEGSQERFRVLICLEIPLGFRHEFGHGE